VLAKRFVYIIRSIRTPERRCIGVTSNVTARLEAHNAGQTPSTASGTPWAIDICIEFRTKQMALKFETYLKSGSGHAFANRHFSEASRTAVVTG